MSVKQLASKILVKYIWLILLFVNMSFSGTTGKIAGRIIDSTTGEPLAAANIVLAETVLGATADLDGYYFIINIPPGKYQVEGHYIGYQSYIITDVKVSVDQTTRIDIELRPEMLEGETIEVVAERPIIQKDLTSSLSKVGGDEIVLLPIENVESIVNLQAGVVDGHFRGGRKNEVKYLIDGISVNDAFSGDFSLQADLNSIQEVQVLSGTFNAEYGEALSGVVNQVTKTPGNKYEGEISVYSGDYFSARDQYYQNIESLSPTDISDFQGSVSGPVPGTKGNLKFFLSGRYNYNDGYLYGKRMFNPSDSSNFSANDPADWYVGATGDNEYVPMNFSETASLQGKLYIRVGEAKWLVLQGLYQKNDYRDYNHTYKLNPDGDYKNFEEGYLGSISYTHVLNPSTFIDFKSSAFVSNSEEYAFEDPLDSRYVNPERKRDVSGAAFLTGGTENWHFYHQTSTFTGKVDLTSQINHIHQIKNGVEVQYHSLEYEDYQTHIDASSNFQPQLPVPGSFDYNTYANNPYQLAAYLQDKIELDYLIVNAGIRFDYFEPDGKTLKDPNNIAALDSQAPPYADTLFNDASAKYQFSPRMGISYPISDGGAIHISYGHFFQMPSFDYLYRNPNFRIPLTGDFPEQVGNVIGNADLEPERTTMYEIGLQQQLSSYIGLSVSAYYKDIRNLIGQEIYIKNDFRKFGQYVNRDYGSVKGVTIAFEKRFSGGFSANVDYTYQIAKGSASDPNDEFNKAQASPPIESNKQLVSLDWDRRHSLNFTVTTGIPGKFISSFVGKFGSGMPYTPSIQNQRTGLENSDNRPSYFNIDLYMTRYFKIYNHDLSVFLKIYNLFDTENEVDVFTDTGRAGYTLELTRAQEEPRGVNTLSEYYTRPDYYSEPRKAILGFTYSF
ncbi:MAG: TonB-dependent receptor [Calditrichaceae bacterium]